MTRKKQAIRHRGVQAPAEKILLLSTIRIVEEVTMPCALDLSVPGVLLWEDYRPIDDDQLKTAAEEELYLRSLQEEQATKESDLSVRLHLCPDHVVVALRQVFPKAAGLEYEWLLSLIGHQIPKCLALVRRLPQKQVEIWLVHPGNPAQILEEVQSFGRL